MGGKHVLFCVGLGTPSHSVAMFEIGHELKRRGHVFSYAGFRVRIRPRCGFSGVVCANGCAPTLVCGTTRPEQRQARHSVDQLQPLLLLALPFLLVPGLGLSVSQEIGQWDKEKAFNFFPVGENAWSGGAMKDPVSLTLLTDRALPPHTLTAALSLCLSICSCLAEEGGCRPDRGPQGRGAPGEVDQ